MLNFLLKILAIDSTSGQEQQLVDFLAMNFQPAGAESVRQPLANGQANLFYTWGHPEIIFCTHLDTVPPYISPTIGGENHQKSSPPILTAIKPGRGAVISNKHADTLEFNEAVLEKTNGHILGRGACDAKGQIAALSTACQELYREKHTNFGLLLVAGEETDSLGAKTANRLIQGCRYVIIGEPTDNHLVTAAKGVVNVAVTVTGKSAHSGYPTKGDNAIERMRQFLNGLAGLTFPEDDLLGNTTYNIGGLHSNNAANVIADNVICNIVFRTTFATHEFLQAELTKLIAAKIKIEFISVSAPQRFLTLPGFKTKTVAFGSDAPHLTNLGECLLYGPGSILNAHAEHECIAINELTRAVLDFKKIYYQLAGVRSL